MTAYAQFCPIAQASEVLAERWTPLVLRELVGGSRRFNDIHRGVPQMSSTLLSKRLRSLERAGILERREDERGRGVEYELTRAGEELGPVLDTMAVWSERWLRRPVEPEDADPRYLMWAIRGSVRTEELPPGRTVAHFRFPREPDKLRYWWLVLDRPDTDLCLSDPGFEVDLTVTCEPSLLASVVAGDRTLASAIRDGDLRLEGTRESGRAFRRWFGTSPAAQIPRPAERPREPAGTGR